jgi:DNA polymerase III delta prime subunit
MKQLYGFDDIKERLRGSFCGGKLHHCNMLVSNEGVGKLSFLKQLSALILSEKDTVGRENISQAMQEQNYLLIENNSHTDFTILNTESFLTEKDQDKKIKDEISIGQIRNLINFLQKTPLLSKNKVVIIDSIDKVNSEGQNALLMTLEEPTRNTFIFLVCNNREKVLQTISSRSCICFLEKLSFENWCRGLLDNLQAEITGALDEEDLEKLYVISNQSIKLAINIINNDGFGLYEDILKMFVKKNIAETQKFCENIDKNKELLGLFKIIIEVFFQDLIAYSANFVENKIVSKNKDMFDYLTIKNPLPKILDNYRGIFSIISSIDGYNMSKKHCLNVIFCNYL